MWQVPPTTCVSCALGGELKVPPVRRLGLKCGERLFTRTHTYTRESETQKEQVIERQSKTAWPRTTSQADWYLHQRVDIMQPDVYYVKKTSGAVEAAAARALDTKSIFWSNCTTPFTHSRTLKRRQGLLLPVGCGRRRANSSRIASIIHRPGAAIQCENEHVDGSLFSPWAIDLRLGPCSVIRAN